jgi:hypothetical protein
MKATRVFASLCIALLAVIMTACPQRASISDIKHDPSRYRDKEVTVVGRVTQSFGAFNQGIYEIDDGSGRLWILSEKLGVPGQGATVGVSGHIIPGVTFAGRNFGTVLRETERRTRS